MDSIIQWRLGKLGKDTETCKHEMTLDDIFKVETRFLLLTYLLIYPELSLPELTKKVGKSKSTVVEHLKLMDCAGLINKRHDTSEHRSLKTKIISLNMEKFSELNQQKEQKKKEKKKEKKILSQEEKIKKLSEGIEVNIGFIDVNLHFLMKWREHLEKILHKVQNGDISAWEEVKGARISILQPFTNKKAKELKEKLVDLIETSEEEDDKEVEQKTDKTKPVFMTANIIPVTYLLDKSKDKKN